MDNLLIVWSGLLASNHNDKEKKKAGETTSIFT